VKSATMEAAAMETATVEAAAHHAAMEAATHHAAMESTGAAHSTMAHTAHSTMAHAAHALGHCRRGCQGKDAG
jgi:hypothetical protein